MPTVELSRFERAALSALLGQGHERGVVYARNREDRKLLKKAAWLGLIDRSGGLTASGEAFIRVLEEPRTGGGSGAFWQADAIRGYR